MLGLLGRDGSPASPAARAGAELVGMALRCLILGVKYKVD